MIRANFMIKSMYYRGAAAPGSSFYFLFRRKVIILILDTDTEKKKKNRENLSEQSFLIPYHLILATKRARTRSVSYIIIHIYIIFKNMNPTIFVYMRRNSTREISAQEIWCPTEFHQVREFP